MKKLLFLFSTLLFIGCIVEVTTIYTLNVSSNPTEGGIINPSSGEYEEGAEVTINVSPNPNYEFDKWSGDWGGSEYPLTLIMDGDKTLVGNFNFLDSDGDGVGDDDDLDNNTRSGVPVDENGVMLNSISLQDAVEKVKILEGKDSSSGVYTTSVELKAFQIIKTIIALTPKLKNEADRVSYKDYKGQFKIIVDNMPSKEICHLVLNQRIQKIEFEKDSFELMKVSAEEIAKHKKRIVDSATLHLID